MLYSLSSCTNGMWLIFRFGQALFILVTRGILCSWPYCSCGRCLWVLGMVKPCLYLSLGVQPTPGLAALGVSVGFRLGQAVFILVTSLLHWPCCTLGTCLWVLGGVKPCLYWLPASYTGLAVLWVRVCGF